MLVNKQYNLKQINPSLAKQWHHTLNGLLTPQGVTPYSNKKVWWLCKKGHKWQSTVSNRNLGVNCPYCSGHKVNKENCLQTFNPKLVEEWHPTKNGKLTPKDVHKGSHKKVWWKCKQGHEWQAIIFNRTKYKGCPFCPKEVNLQYTLQISNPKVSKEWHPTKNGKLTPKNVHKGSNKKVWWLCKKGHEWEAKIYRRNNGRGCPYCLNQKVNVDNCLETNNKILSMQWHPTRNGMLTPKDVTFGSHKSVWWLCKQGHEWKAVVKDRNKGRGCPMCKPKTSQLELRIFSELSLFFDDIIQRKKIFGFECDVFIPSINIAIEFDGYYWHKNKHKKDKNKNIQLNKNGITLFRVREYKLRKISESDIILSKSVNEFEIIKGLLILILNTVSLNNKTRKKIKIYLRNKKIKNENHYLNLLSLLPSPLPGSSLYDINYKLGKQWHPVKNGNLTPKDLTPGSGKRIWWICKKGHEWQATVGLRNQGYGCPYCSGQKVNKENCLQTLNPKLAKDWHLSKNGKLTPKDVTVGSRKKIWWKCKQGHQYETAIVSRSRGVGCPYCSGHKVNKENCLQTLNPKLAKDWHPTKNSHRTPDDFTVGSGKKVWWLCKKGHEWKTSISHRNNGRGCPYCSGKKVNKDNSLQTLNPKLAEEWHPTKNKKLTSNDVSLGSEKKVWWLCKKGHEWEAILYNRNKGVGCPYCSNKRVNVENCLLTTNPELAKQWHPTKNGILTPKDVTYGSEKKVWWICKKGHSWEAKILNRSHGKGCPYCSGHKVSNDNSLLTLKPKLAKEWHPTKNNKLTPNEVSFG